MLNLQLDHRPITQDQSLLAGLVAWWNPLPSPEWNCGPKFRDLLGRYDATLQAAPTWSGLAPVNRYRSLRFVRASSQYCSVGAAVVASTPLTLCGWFMSDGDANSQEILSVCNSAASGDGWRLNINGATQVVRAITSASGANRLAATTAQFNANQWYFAAAVFASSTSRIAYLNLAASTEETTSAMPTTPTATSIGRLEFLTPINHFSGWLSDLRVYNRALSAAELAELYLLGLAGHRRAYSYVQSYVGIVSSSFTGSAAVTIGGVTCSATATFTNPTYTGAGAVAIRGATCSVSATFTKPTYTGSAAVSVGGATCNASATFSKPTYTGNVAASVGGATCNSSATFSPPGAVTGTVAVSTKGATCAVSATFDEPIYTASVVVVVGGIVCVVTSAPSIVVCGMLWSAIEDKAEYVCGADVVNFSVPSDKAEFSVPSE